MSRGKIALVVLGAFLALLGFAAMLGGAGLVWAHETQRNDAGYYWTGPHELSSTTGVITSDRVDLGSRAPGDWTPFDDIGDVRIDAATTDGSPMFVGIGPSDAVDAYLNGVAHDQLTDVDRSPFRAQYDRHDGQQSPAPPQGQSFWVASTAGPGMQTLTWDINSGDWKVVLMHPDGSPAIDAQVSAGIKTGVLLPIGLGVSAFGVLLMVLAAVFLILGLRHVAAPATEEEQAAAGTTAVAGVAVTDAYPARLDGHLDEPLSRWLWLVKWILLIPHFFVLVFLWLATIVLTFVAGVAILFTGRYPRSLFDFNVGVMRWTWRVSFYAMSAFATDRYPPFSLQPDPDYPADFHVDYPEQLSRGLVLVKWWLLAIPHYLIVAIFAGGWSWGTSDDWRVMGSGGLIAVVALIAAVVVAVRGRYPRELFHFVMGLNRWCFRVLAYVALMRDEYPPFRFDGGGTDPGSVPAPPAPPTPPATDEAPDDRAKELIQ